MFVNYHKYTDWTRESIEEMLSRSDDWVERAIVVLYQRQTELEKMTHTTYDDNERGFQVADAKEFTSYAKQILAGKHLNAMQLRRARRPWRRGRRAVQTIAKYRGQLLRIIEAKAKAERARV